MFCRRRLAAARETKAVGIKPVASNGRNLIVTIILTGECGLSLLIYAHECIRSSNVCPSEPMVIARTGTLAALAVIAAAIGAGPGYAALVLMAAAS
jgi:hypothetical protein